MAKSKAPIRRIVPKPIPKIVGKEIPALGSAGSPVGVAPAISVAVTLGVAVNLGVAVAPVGQVQFVWLGQDVFLQKPS